MGEGVSGDENELTSRPKKKEIKGILGRDSTVISQQTSTRTATGVSIHRFVRFAVDTSQKHPAPRPRLPPPPPVPEPLRRLRRRRH